MIDGEAEASEAPVRCSSLGGSRRTDSVYRACPALGWEIAGDRRRHVPARTAAGDGHNCRGGQTCGQG
jgi:hypothetical protein